MPFVDVCRAVYDYSPNAEEELEIKEGDVLLVLEKSSDDDWWKAKRKAANEDDEEPEGLVPANYLEKVQPLKQARALYDYSEQQDEEISFSDGARLDVFDESDPDWTLVGLGGKYGFAPAIYLEAATGAPPAASAAPAPALPSRELAPPPMPARPQTYDDPIPGEADYPDPGQGPTPELEPQANNPAAPWRASSRRRPEACNPRRRGIVSDDEAPPPMPTRPKSQIASPSLPPQASPRSPEPPGVMSSPPYNRVTSGQWGDDPDSDAARSPGGFHLYNIHEVVKHMGKNKKMPTTLGINNAKGLIMISPEKSRDGPSNEWTADKLTHYSIEGKHVFIDLVRPSKSIDFHAGAKDTAHEIVAHLGELAGAVRAEGLKEVWAAGAGTGAAGKKKGKMLYEFIAQGDDEVTVAVDDEVIVLDDTASDEWWKVKRVRNGKEGVVPSSYVEITGTIQGAPDTITGLNAARSTVEQNRLEDERLAKEAARSKKDDSVPERHSSLAGETSRTSSRRADKRASKDQSKSKPNQARVRTWTDRSGTFKVEAEFIGLRDGKIHLHKQNGVKIAVPVNKMAVEDLEYVERATGTSLDDDKPLVDLKRKGTSKPNETNGTRAGASVQKTQDEYDWFDFFLQCGVNPQICERYAAAFSRDQMSPEILPEVDDKLLRTLGLKEGDILRVTKFLDIKYDRKRAPAADAESSDVANGGLFSGPGGALRNNTRKGRPAPPVSTNDVVSEDAFKPRSPAPADIKETPLASASARQPNSGFDDDAWDVKPARTQTATTPAPAPAPAEPPKTVEPLKPKVNDDLSLLAMPLQPEKTGPATAAAQPTQPTAAASAPAPSQQPQQQQGADQALFEKIAALAPPRQRPQPPAQQPMATGLAPPPRAASAPGFNPQQQGSQFAPPPLQPQLTGVPPQQQMYPQQTGYPQQQMNGLQPQQVFQGFQPTGVQAMQQNYPALQPQPTGMAFQPQSAFGQQQAMQQYPQQNGFPPQQTGFPGQPNYQQALVNGAQTGSPFADPPRQPFQPTPLGLSNSFGPQQTGYQQPQPSFNISQPTGMNGMNGYQAPPVPQLPPQQTGGVFGPSQPIAPLVPQKTGPPPPVRFGVTGAANRLMPQPTGRANLAKATPQNPFGF
ncbi:Actin cytoskeleton-regulatory complex protein sla1 [Teratosphaeria destructans]|uniref:Actin cytoskeleton-regulatory complex protein SLA1 n=1 Tax=Teratosphaeria destructans TaxID=418781 RepID=A0A9W7SNA5_9PEZI|nr:Actin cytoskeleton-regulatory complex protein sla1 [Teratosphaeria destructans]